MLAKINQIYQREGLSGIIFRIDNKLRTLSAFYENRRWLKKHTPTADYIEETRSKFKSFDYKPLISVILPVYNSDHKFLRECLDSIIQQTYENWELCIANDASTDVTIKSILAEYSVKYENIKVIHLEINSHIAKASNAALTLAQGEFLAFIDHDDLLPAHALFEVVSALQSDSGFDLIYTNEDKIDRKGRRTEPCFKPGLDLEYFLSFMYIGHLAVYRRSLVEELGGFRPGTEGAQDYDLALRVLEKTKRVLHVPKILYHWRKHPESVAQNVDAKPYAYRSMRKVLNEALGRRANPEKAWLEETAVINVNRPRFEVPQSKKIAVLLRNFDEQTASLLVSQIDNIKHELHFIIEQKNSQVDGLSNLEAVTSVLKAQNFSEYFYQALTKFDFCDYLYSFDCQAEFDITSLDYLIEQSQRQEIACVGSRILSADRKKCLHAAYTLHQNLLRHNFYQVALMTPGYGARLLVQRSASVVSSYSALYRIADLLKIKNLERSFYSTEAFEVNVCLALAELGKTILWTPFADISLKPDSLIFPEEVRLSTFNSDYQQLIELYKIDTFRDPFYPEGLDTHYLDFRVAI